MRALVKYAVLGMLGIVSAWSAAPQLNEVMARNDWAVKDSQGRVADWVEISNPGLTPASLAGFSLSVDDGPANQWIFPAGAQIPASGFLVVWCDGLRPASTRWEQDMNCGHSLAAENGSVRLYNSAGLSLDVMEYGHQLLNISLGRSGGRWALMATPTPGKANSAPAPLAGMSGVRINEWMAKPLAGDDWFELCNRSTAPVELGGSFLSNDPAQATLQGLPPYTFLGVGGDGFLRFWADKTATNGATHVMFRLDAKSGILLLYGPATNLIDRVDYAPQTLGISEGRLPDGGSNIVAFPSTPTPGESNYQPLDTVVINEILTHTDPPLEDAVELFNPSTESIDVGGWFLSNTTDDLKKYRISDGTIVAANGFLVIYEYQFIGTNNFTFNSAHGGQAMLSTGDAQGNLTGYRLKISFGSAANGISFGRYATSVGVEFVAMSRHTFGMDNPRTTTEFRLGRGAPNAYPLVGPVVINEIMYHPPDLGGTNKIDNITAEYLELHNLTTRPIPLYDPEAPTNRWKIEGDVSFTMPSGLVLPANAFWLVVSFDPVLDTNALAEFRLQYPNLPKTAALLGPYTGKLSNSEGVIEWYKPDPPQQYPHPDAGYVPYVLVERIQYSDTAPWPVEADGSGVSLQRKAGTDYGNDPVNWRAAQPTPGRDNEASVMDTDGDGMPDWWEIANGLNLDPGDARLDKDQDGLTNLQEFLAGTNPSDPNSVLKCDAVTLALGGLELQFTAVAGKSYGVQYLNNHAAAGWITLTNLDPQHTTRTMSVTDYIIPLSPARYYRLVTPAQP
jgi:hypothetical protein